MNNLAVRILLFFIFFILTFSAYPQENDPWDLPLNTESKKAIDLFKKGVKAMNDVRIAQATTLFSDAITEDPNFFIPNYMLAIRYLYFGNQDEFLASGKKALSANNLTKGEIIIQQALKKLVENPNSDVTEFGHQLVNLYPNSFAAHQVLVTFQMFSEKTEEANKTYLAMLELTENDAPIYNMLGYNYMAQNKMNKAKEAFEKYMELMPENPNVYDSMGDYLSETGAFQKAYEYYMKAYQMDSVNFKISYNKANQMKAKINN